MRERIEVPLGAGPVSVGGVGQSASAEPGGPDAQEMETAALRAEIRDTRDRVGETLEQIGERLNPQHIKEQVTEHVRDATIGKVGNMARSAADRVEETVGETRSTIVETIRQNPIPAAMVGLGLGWLFMNRRQGPTTGPYRDPRYEYARPVYRSDSYDEFAARNAEGGGAVDRARERASELGRDVKETAGDLAHRAQEAASTVADRTRYQARRVEDRFYESPLGVGAATLALGLAAGLALPAPDAEVVLVGDARDRVVDRARDLATQTKDKVQHVAERVIDESKGTAAEAARAEGLTPG